MPIQKENHKKIVLFLDKFGQTKANGIGKDGDEVMELTSFTRDPLTPADLNAILEVSKTTGQKVKLTANGRRIFITYC